MAMDVDVEEHLQTVTPSPVVSPSGSPRNSRSRVMTPVQGDSPVGIGSSRSETSQSSSRKSKVLTPSQLENQSLMVTPSGSSSRRLRISTPLEEASTPSPVVSPMTSSLMESSGGFSRKPSSSSSRTPPTSMTTTSELRHSRQPRSGSLKSSRNRSRSDVTAASPIVAGRRLAPEMVTTMPNSTVNFSPQIASTQNVAAMSRVGIDQGHGEEQGEGDEDSIDEDDLEQLSDEMEGEHRNETDERQTRTTAMQQNPHTTVKTKRKPRKPRQKSNYSMPVNIVKKQFTHFAGLRVSKEAVEEVMKVSEKYWDNLALDLEAYAKHAHRKQIKMADFVLLFKRQGHVTEKQSLKSLIEKYLPMEERERLIPVARAGNRIEPSL